MAGGKRRHQGAGHHESKERIGPVGDGRSRRRRIAVGQGHHDRRAKVGVGRQARHSRDAPGEQGALGGDERERAPHGGADEAHPCDVRSAGDGIDDRHGRPQGGDRDLTIAEAGRVRDEEAEASPGQPARETLDVRLVPPGRCGAVDEYDRRLPPTARRPGDRRRHAGDDAVPDERRVGQALGDVFGHRGLQAHRQDHERSPLGLDVAAVREPDGSEREEEQAERWPPETDAGAPPPEGGGPRPAIRVIESIGDPSPPHVAHADRAPSSASGHGPLSTISLSPGMTPAISSTGTTSRPASGPRRRRAPWAVPTRDRDGFRRRSRAGSWVSRPGIPDNR